MFTSSLAYFCFPTQMSHGLVLKSGLKLVQMFSNDRLQCQHKPTSTFAYIFLFDVVQMNFTVSQTHSGLLGSLIFLFFVLLIKKSCLNRTLSLGTRLLSWLYAVWSGVYSHVNGENVTGKSEQMLRSLLVEIRIFLMNYFIVISVQA